MNSIQYLDEINLLLEWQPNFGLFIVAGDAEQCRHLFSLLNQENRPIRYFKPTLKTGFDDAVYTIVDPENQHVDSKTPLWIDFGDMSENQDFRITQNEIIEMLNRGRSQLEKNFARPLFLQIDTKTLSVFASLAPDLWSIKTHSSIFR
jgi:hypothetical protein